MGRVRSRWMHSEARGEGGKRSWTGHVRDSSIGADIKLPQVLLHPSVSTQTGQCLTLSPRKRDAAACFTDTPHLTRTTKRVVPRESPPHHHLTTRPPLAPAIMSAIIRPVAEQDEQVWRRHWGSYNEFYKRTVSETVTATTFARFLDPSTQMFCAVAVAVATPGGDGGGDGGSGSEVIGFVTWYPHPSTSRIGPVVYLNDLFVDPEIRSKGVGGLLMDHVFEHSRRELGAESVYWHTQHFNHRAQLLYVKKGAKSDFVHYSKSLTDA